MRKKSSFIVGSFIAVAVCFGFTFQSAPVNSAFKKSTTEEGGNLFIVKNSVDISIPVEKIDLVHRFESNETGGGFHCVTTSENSATDYGPYRELYFVFENEYEMPHRTAVYHIGSLGQISSFKKRSSGIYEVEGHLFSHDGKEIQAKVKITIDANAVIEVNSALDKADENVEGDMQSQIIVTVDEIE